MGRILALLIQWLEHRRLWRLWDAYMKELGYD